MIISEYIFPIGYQLPIMKTCPNITYSTLGNLLNVYEMDIAFHALDRSGINVF